MGMGQRGRGLRDHKGSTGDPGAAVCPPASLASLAAGQLGQAWHIAPRMQQADTGPCSPDAMQEARERKLKQIVTVLMDLVSGRWAEAGPAGEQEGRRAVESTGVKPGGGRCTVKLETLGGSGTFQSQALT